MRFNGKKGLMPKSPTQDAIYNACEKGSFDYDHVTYSIWWYVQQNSRAHNGVTQMIRVSRFKELGNRLYWDL